MSFSLNEVEWEYVRRLGCRGTADLKAFAAEGLYRGGDEIVFRLVGDTKILPHSIEAIVEAGVRALNWRVCDASHSCGGGT